MAMATKAFVPFWLLMAGINMWVGVSYAGYSVRQEFPILLLVFSVSNPSVVCCWVVLRGPRDVAGLGGGAQLAAHRCRRAGDDGR